MHGRKAKQDKAISIKIVINFASMQTQLWIISSNGTQTQSYTALKSKNFAHFNTKRSITVKRKQQDMITFVKTILVEHNKQFQNITATT